MQNLLSFLLSEKFQVVHSTEVSEMEGREEKSPISPGFLKLRDTLRLLRIEELRKAILNDDVSIETQLENLKDISEILCQVLDEQRYPEFKKHVVILLDTLVKFYFRKNEKFLAELAETSSKKKKRRKKSAENPTNHFKPFNSPFLISDEENKRNAEKTHSILTNQIQEAIQSKKKNTPFQPDQKNPEQTIILFLNATEHSFYTEVDNNLLLEKIKSLNIHGKSILDDIPSSILKSVDSSYFDRYFNLYIHYLTLLLDNKPLSSEFFTLLNTLTSLIKRLEKNISHSTELSIYAFLQQCLQNYSHIKKETWIHLDEETIFKNFVETIHAFISKFQNHQLLYKEVEKEKYSNKLKYIYLNTLSSTLLYLRVTCFLTTKEENIEIEASQNNQILTLLLICEIKNAFKLIPLIQSFNRLENLLSLFQKIWIMSNALPEETNVPTKKEISFLKKEEILSKIEEILKESNDVRISSRDGVRNISDLLNILKYPRKILSNAEEENIENEINQLEIQEISLLRDEKFSIITWSETCFQLAKIYLALGKMKEAIFYGTKAFLLLSDYCYDEETSYAKDLFEFEAVFLSLYEKKYGLSIYGLFNKIAQNLPKNLEETHLKNHKNLIQKIKAICLLYWTKKTYEDSDSAKDSLEESASTLFSLTSSTQEIIFDESELADIYFELKLNALTKPRKESRKSSKKSQEISKESQRISHELLKFLGEKSIHFTSTSLVRITNQFILLPIKLVDIASVLNELFKMAHSIALPELREMLELQLYFFYFWTFSIQKNDGIDPYKEKVETFFKKIADFEKPDLEKIAKDVLFDIQKNLELYDLTIIKNKLLLLEELIIFSNTSTEFGKSIEQTIREITNKIFDFLQEKGLYGFSICLSQQYPKNSFFLPDQLLINKLELRDRFAHTLPNTVSAE